MSEVKRYETWADSYGNYGENECDNGKYILASDFDRVVAEFRKVLQQWFVADCPDMTCGMDYWTCELCTKTKALLKPQPQEDKP